MSNKTPQSQEAEYWKQRCLAAEDAMYFLAVPDNEELYHLWQEKHALWIDVYNSYPKDLDIHEASLDRIRALELAAHVTPINAGDIPTPSKGQELSEDGLSRLMKIRDVLDKIREAPDNKFNSRHWLGVVNQDLNSIIQDELNKGQETKEE